jgi:hypothetical protein
MHFRQQRGSLEESLKTVVDLQDRKELVKHLRRVLAPMKVQGKNVQVRYYGYDERINWPSYLVTLDGKAVGFIDGKI